MPEKCTILTCKFTYIVVSLEGLRQLMCGLLLLKVPSVLNRLAMLPLQFENFFFSKHRRKFIPVGGSIYTVVT